MNRKEFLAQLERLLWDIPVQEREEALEFYNSYFDDAGEENESSVIQELGSPGKVAAIIKADLGESRKEYGEYTETGYSDGIFDDRNMPERAGAESKKDDIQTKKGRHRRTANTVAREATEVRMAADRKVPDRGASGRTALTASMEMAAGDMTALTAEADTAQKNPAQTEAGLCGESLSYS